MTGKDLIPFRPEAKPIAGEPTPRRFRHTDRIGIGIGVNGKDSGVCYRCVDSTKDGHFFKRTDNSGLLESFTHEEIAAFENSPGWRYDPNFFSVEKAEAKLKICGGHFADLPFEQRQRALHKQIICDALLLLFATEKVRRSLEKAAEQSSPSDSEVRQRPSRSDAGLKCALQIVIEQKRHVLDSYYVEPHPDGIGTRSWIPCPKTVRKWLKDYLDADRNVLALLDGYVYGNHKSPLDTDLQNEVFKASLEYAKDGRLSVRGAQKILKMNLVPINKAREAAGLKPFPCPDWHTIDARIQANGAFFNYAGRYSEEVAKLHFPLVMGGLEIDIIGERVEMDFWKVHLMTFIRYSDLWSVLSQEQKVEIQKARWVLCVALDCASRSILGMRLSPTETTDAALATSYGGNWVTV